MSSRLLLKTVFFALFATAVPASAQVSYRYTKIADTRGELREVANVGINNRGDVVFLGSFDAGGRVVFTGNEERLQVVADTRAGQFEDLVEEATINDRGAVAFASRGASPAVWKWYRGQLTKIAALSDGPFSDVGGGPSISAAGDVAFWGRLTDDSQAILVRETDGALRRVAGAGFSSLDFSPALADSGAVAFIGQTATGVDGVFIGDQHGVRTIADSTGRFHVFSGGVGVNSADTVVFHANQDTGPSVISIASAPSGGGDLVDDAGVFAGVSRPTINSAGLVAFQGLTAGTHGVFTGADPSKDKVIGVGDSLDGEPVTSLDFFRGLNDRGQIAFVAHFLTYSAVYRADPVRP